MRILNLPGRHGTSTRLQLSSNAARPMMRLIIEGGEMIDPRDDRCLARLPVSNNLELDVYEARALVAGLNEFIELLEADSESDAYLHLDDQASSTATLEET